MRELYDIINIRSSQGNLLAGWCILVKRQNCSCEYRTEVYYKDGMQYWISEDTRDLPKLIEETIDKIEWIVKNIPEDALNSKQQWSHVKSFGNYAEREFVMLLKCNGRAELRRFHKTQYIFNHSVDFIPDSTEMLEEDWGKAFDESDVKK